MLAPDESMLDAAKAGDVEAVTRALAEGTNVNMKDSKHGRTAAHWAALHQHAPLLAALVKAPGINLLQTDNYGQAPVHLAVLGAACIPPATGEGGAPDRTSCLNLLLDAGVHASYGDKQGLTPLHLAVLTSAKDFVQALAGRLDPWSLDAKEGVGDVKRSTLCRGCGQYHLVGSSSVRLLDSGGRDTVRVTDSSRCPKSPHWPHCTDASWASLVAKNKVDTGIAFERPLVTRPQVAEAPVAVPSLLTGVSCCDVVLCEIDRLLSEI